MGGRFRVVWVGESVSGLGDAAFLVAFGWLVLSATGSPAALAGTLVAAAVPRGVLLLAGGVVVDRLSARTVLLSAHLARALAVGAVAAAAAAGKPGLAVLVVGAVVVGAADAFAGPAGTAVLPSLVEPRQLPRANALVAAAGPATVLALDALTFLLAAATVSAAPRRAATPAEGPLWTDIGTGLRWAAATREVRAVLVVVAAATLSYAGLFGVGLPALAATGGGSLGYGALVSAWGVGQLAGSVAAGVTGLPRRWGRLVGLMCLAEAATFAAIGVAGEVAVAAGLLALLGVGVAYSQDVALPTWLQARTPPDRLGRTSALLQLARTALEPVSLAGTGLLAAVDVRLAFAVAALPVLASGCWLLATPALRDLGLAAAWSAPTGGPASEASPGGAG